MNSTDNMIERLLLVLYQRLTSPSRKPDVLLDRMLTNWPARPKRNHRKKLATRQPAVDYFEQALNNGEVSGEKELCLILRQLIPNLSWDFGYQPHPGFPGLDEKIAFSPLLGPDDLWLSSQLAIGLTLIAPETLYPAHHHPAAEIYLPLSGTGLWSMGNADFHPRTPGELIVHDSHISHATQTQKEPVLALYIWSGDLVSPSEWLHRASN